MRTKSYKNLALENQFLPMLKQKLVLLVESKNAFIASKFEGSTKMGFRKAPAESLNLMRLPFLECLLN
jgi:hypothetical protein